MISSKIYHYRKVGMKAYQAIWVYFARFRGRNKAESSSGPMSKVILSQFHKIAMKHWEEKDKKMVGGENYLLGNDGT